MQTPIAVYVQARMSSGRFPGKVLAPFRGIPVIRHVLTAVERALPGVPTVVVTSAEVSDDPLVAYLRPLNVAVFRGPLDNVFERFRLCVTQYPCEWILRVSADSPLLEPYILRTVTSHASDREHDLVTTTFPRTFPKGQNAELIRASTLMAVDSADLSADDREHVTAYFYRHSGRFRIFNVSSGNPRLAELNLAVDTVDDLRRLSKLSPGGAQDGMDSSWLTQNVG